MQRRSFLATAAAMCAIGGASVADAQQATRIAFDNAWRAVNFPRLSPTRYGLGGRNPFDCGGCQFFADLPGGARCGTRRTDGPVGLERDANRAAHRSGSQGRR